MIREWLEVDGTYARFDTFSKVIEYVDGNGANVVPTHQATEAELARVLELFPETPAEVTERKMAISSILISTLQSLRSATSDGVITPAEFYGLNPSVVSALTAYRDYPERDADVDRLVILLLTQVNFAYSILLAAGQKSMQDLQSYALTLETKIENVEDILSRNGLS